MSTPLRRSLRRLSLCLIASLALLVSAATARADTPPKWRMLFYACADELPGDNRLMERLLRDAFSAASPTLEVVAFVDPYDNNGRFADMTICGQRFDVPAFIVSRGDGACSVRVEPERDVACGKPETLKERLLDRVAGTPPSIGTILVLAGHGDGWAGCVWEPVPPVLKTTGVRDALGEFHPKLLVLHACHMAQLEALAPLVDSADYLAAGEMTIEASCIQYSQFMRWLDATPDAPTEQVAQRLGRCYHCDECEECGLRRRAPKLFTVFESSRVKEAARRCRALADAFSSLAGDEKATVLAWLRRSRARIRDYSGEEKASVDLGRLLDDDPISGVAAFDDTAKLAKEALDHAPVCRAGSPRLEAFSGTAALLACRGGWAVDSYQKYVARELPGWENLVSAFVASCRSGEGLKPGLFLPEGRLVVDKTGAVSLDLRFDAEKSDHVVRLSVAARDAAGRPIACGVTLPRTHWTAEGVRVRAQWDGLAPWLYSDRGRMPVAVGFSSASNDPAEVGDARVELAHSADDAPCTSTPVELLFVSRDGASTSFALSRALDRSASWPDAIDVSGGLLTWSADAGAACAAAAPWALEVGDSRALALVWQRASPSGASLAVTAEFDSGATATTRWVEIRED